MRFFEDFKVSKDESIGITNLLSNITTRDGSHKGGWARLLRCQLKEMGYSKVTILDNKNSLSEFGIIIFDLGAEYSGALNMFGGLDEKVFNRLSQLDAFKGRLFSWRHQLPDLKVLEARRQNVSTCEQFKSTTPRFLESISEALLNAGTFDHAYRTNALLIGDSHTPSVWDPSFMIERRDGRTLKGMLEHKTIEKYVLQFPEVTKLKVHCGSIDVRHHLCRLADPELEAASLIVNLVTQIHELPQIKEVVLHHTMGIENESRELPKTGYFKGTPFAGTWEQRNTVRNVFNEVIDEYTKDCPGWSSEKFPSYFFDDSGKLKEEVMEVPGSVHLSPMHYAYNLEARTFRKYVMDLLVSIEKDMYGA